MNYFFIKNYNNIINWFIIFERFLYLNWSHFYMNPKEFFYVDPNDKWNWILGVLAIFLLWWGIKTIIQSLSIP